ncbi:hypothetical protein BKA65DRAFT_574239 [Rhexocercosporidium sp. MPI-PUGE-AT-0058]|nr:hypothetical protein BKA65DRAFT_574239 [Rhexocercosporidium sp. MPI-PUGE-AT-0058]
MSDFHQGLLVCLTQSPPQTPSSSATTSKAPLTPYTYSTSNDTSPFTSYTTPTTPSTPIKPTCAVLSEQSFGDFGTPNPTGLATRSEAHDEIVSSIMELPLDEWLTQGQAAVYGEQLWDQQGAEILQGKFVEAFEAASRAQSMCAEILRDCPSIDSNTHAFRIFKTWTLAKLLYDQPEMATRLKIEVSNKGFNAGYTKVCEWIDIVAQDAEGMLDDLAIHCDQVEEYDLGDGVNLQETLVAMQYYFENNYEELCSIYPEYKTVPVASVEDEGTISESGRPVRVSRARERMGVERSLVEVDLSKGKLGHGDVYAW